MWRCQPGECQARLPTYRPHTGCSSFLSYFVIGIHCTCCELVAQRVRRRAGDMWAAASDGRRVHGVPFPAGGARAGGLPEPGGHSAAADRHTGQQGPRSWWSRPWSALGCVCRLPQLMSTGRC